MLSPLNCIIYKLNIDYKNIKKNFILCSLLKKTNTKSLNHTFYVFYALSVQLLERYKFLLFFFCFFLQYFVNSEHIKLLFFITTQFFLCSTSINMKSYEIFNRYSVKFRIYKKNKY